MARSKLRWICGSGGPLILLPERLLESWDGVDPPRDNRVIKAKMQLDPDGPATDYDRACDVEAAIENIEVGDGRGIVLGGEPCYTTFIEQDGETLLVRWVQADSEQQILERIAELAIDSEGASVAMIEADPGPLVLFDAACPGGEVDDDRLTIDVSRGQFLASAADLAPDDEFILTVIKLERVG